jgi:hypothetical protein
MHPSAMKNSLLAAAAKASQDGFSGTAAALSLLAEACSDEARELIEQTAEKAPEGPRYSPLSGNLISIVSH